MPTTLERSLALYAAGHSVIPITADGKKEPDFSVAGHPVLNRKRRATLKELHQWFEDGLSGIGILGGEISENDVFIDIEYMKNFDQWRIFVEGEVPGLLDRLTVIRTPGKDVDGGRHVAFRSPTPLKTVKLAYMTAKDAEERSGDPNKRTLIEIKAEGGYVVSVGSPSACHASGRLYEHISGPSLENIATVTAEEVDVLVSCAGWLNRDGPEETQIEYGPREHANGHNERSNGEIKPGDAYNLNHDAVDELRSAHWTPIGSDRNKCRLTRPGKKDGVSATFGYCHNPQGIPLFYVFSTNAAPFEAGRGYSPFAVYTILLHNGDFKASARALGLLQYGSPPKKPKPRLNVDGVKVNVKSEDMTEDVVSPKTEAKTSDRMVFPIDAFPPLLKAYCQSVADSLSCPLDFPAVTVLSLAASVIGYTRAIAITRTWVEAPRFYLAIIADSGGSKTPVHEQVSAPMIQQQQDRDENWHFREEMYQEAMVEYDTARKRASGNNRNGPAVVVPQRPVEPIYEHLVTMNATVEGLQPILAENPRGLLLLKDEIVALVNECNQYKGGKGSDRQFYLSVWSGQATKTDRKGTRSKGPIFVAHPFLNILGGIQPEMLGQLIDEKGRQDGFVERFLFSYPEEKGWPEHIGQAVDEDLEQAWSRIYCGLLKRLQLLPDGEKKKRPYILKMDSSGKAVAKEWYARHARERNDPDFQPGLVGAWSKMRSYFFRIAVVVHCLRQETGEIEIDPEPLIDGVTMQSAVRIIEYFKSHVQLVHPQLRSTAEDRKVQRVVNWMRRTERVKIPVGALQTFKFANTAEESIELANSLQSRCFGKVTEDSKRKGAARFTFHLFNGHEKNGDASVE